MSKSRKPQRRSPATTAARSAGVGGVATRTGPPTRTGPATRTGAVRLGGAPGEPAGAGHGAGAGHVGGAARGAAVGLWVLVSGGLLYGVVQTVLKAAQLFA
jgi:hypothetical protein